MWVFLSYIKLINIYYEAKQTYEKGSVRCKSSNVASF